MIRSYFSKITHNNGLEAPLKKFRTFSSNNKYSTIMDQKERETFIDYHEKWWNLNNSIYPLHALNEIRVSFIRETLYNKNAVPHQPLKRTKILDVGCGAGIYAEALAKLGASVVAIDPLRESIDAAKTHLNKVYDKNSHLDLKYINSDISSIKNEFLQCMDLITLSEVVEHILDWESVLIDSLDCLKPGGSVLITTINRTTLAYVLAILGAEYILGLIPKGTHSYEKLVRPDEISNVLKRNGLEIRHILGYIYNPLTGRWSYAPTSAVNYILYAQKPF